MKTNNLSNHLCRILFSAFILVSTNIQAQLKYLPNTNDLPPHPRILMLAGEEQQIKNNIAADRDWNNVHQSMIKECDKLLTTPVEKRVMIGIRLLNVSREVLRRIFQLSYAYRMTGEAKYAERAEKEMLAVSAFSDWNPSHFLDVAEMTTAVAIGYDWLYDKLSPESRQIIKTAILQKGIEPSLNSKNTGWLKKENNWNQVCHTGMSFGALAIFEDKPDLSKMIIERAIENIQIPMHEYAPDGAYPEGFMYWGYGTSYNLMLISAIEKIWKTDFGLSAMPGFMKTTDFILHMIGATGLCFNYSDSGLGGSMHAATLFWFVNKTNNKSILWNEREYLKENNLTKNRLLPTAMLWGSNVRMTDIDPPKELMWVGRGATPVALMRTSWTDPNAIFVGFKGGKASSPHAHMDAGTFVMEADGFRWAWDFEHQDYNSLQQRGVDRLSDKGQDSQRWQVFRLNNFVHNTLTVNNQLHVVDGFADILSWSSTPDFMNAVIDLSKVFEGQLLKCTRGIAIVSGQYVAVRDEFTALKKETTVRWTLLTKADVTIKENNTVELKKNGKMLTLQVVEPANVTMKTWSTAPTQVWDDPNPGSALVGFEVKIPAGSSSALTVKLIPQNAKNTGAKVPELKNW